MALLYMPTPLTLKDLDVWIKKEADLYVPVIPSPSPVRTLTALLTGSAAALSPSFGQCT
jgi:hypothetical protein